MGSREVIRPSLFGTFIIAAVYLPILTLSGVEGKMFTPMALTVLMALTGASILSLTFVPAAVALLVTGSVSGHENFFMRSARRIYAPLLAASIRNRFGVAVIAALLVALCSIAASRMGAEFIPGLDEGDVSFEAFRIPGTSLTQSVEMQEMIEKRLRQDSGSQRGICANGHGGGCDRPDAAVGLGRLRDAEAAEGMAKS